MHIFNEFTNIALNCLKSKLMFTSCLQSAWRILKVHVTDGRCSLMNVISYMQADNNKNK